MATMDKIIALLKAHYDRNDESFNTLALQIAASEARAGHGVIANEIRNVVEKSRRPSQRIAFMNTAMSDMIQRAEIRYGITDLVVSEDIQKRIERIILEYSERVRLKRNALQNRNKILIGGPSGTGKTMTASVIATETDLPLYIIRLDKVITKFMGATSAKLGEVFDVIEQYEGVYLFDEFDALGADRNRDNEVGEMRRILTSFLMFMERTGSESIIVAATNQLDVLDSALFRRFDDVIKYSLPSDDEIMYLIKRQLDGRLKPALLRSAAKLLSGYSQATVCAVCKDSIKESILTNQPISKNMLQNIIREKLGYTLAV